MTNTTPETKKPEIITIEPIDISCIEQFLEQSKSMEEKSKSVIITSDEQELEVADILKTIKGLQKKVETSRKEKVTPLNEEKNKIQAYYKGPIDLLKGAENYYKKSLVAYFNIKEQKRREEEEKRRSEERKLAEADRQRKLAEAAEAEKYGNQEEAEEILEEALAVTEVAVITEKIKAPSGISYKTTWKAEVTDFSKIPRVWLSVNYQALNAHARNTQGKVPIAGIKMISSKAIASRSN